MYLETKNNQLHITILNPAKIDVYNMDILEEHSKSSNLEFQKVHSQFYKIIANTNSEITEFCKENGIIPSNVSNNLEFGKYGNSFSGSGVTVVT